jgi:phospholipid/cholesterol/gamma-HCH transport system ATP-binding protein
MKKVTIKTQGLDIGYGKENLVITDVNFEIRAGEIFTILGGSGCGKTTLMRSLLGLENPLAGKIYINNIDVLNANSKEIKEVKKNMGVMFQSGALISSSNLLDNIMLPLEEHLKLPRSILKEAAFEKLERVGLEDYAYYYPANISGGMVKRASIARAMALDPNIIFLDEPSAGLDPITQTDLDQKIKSLAHDFGITFVIITHELATINTIADRAIVLNNKKVVASGDIDYLKTQVDDPFVKRFFNPKKVIS